MTLPAELAAQLEAYYRLLATWNTKINLTGLTLSEVSPDAVDRLLIEPIVAARYVPSKTARMLDAGSGGGSPAIPLALAVPSVRLLMVESKTRNRQKSGIFARSRAHPRLDRRRDGDGTELLARPDLHEAHDLVTVRAVRVESWVLLTLQAFAKPGGLLFLFRGSGTSDPSESVTPPLAWKATYPLIESLRSRLVVLEKRATPGGVPRGTIK